MRHSVPADLVEAIVLARGNTFVHPFPEAGEARHAIALLALAARIVEAGEAGEA